MARKHNKVGRPSKMTGLILQKLELAFKMGFSDRLACLLAGIGASTLYDYQHKNPEFPEQKQLWKCNPAIKAKMAVFNNLDNPTYAFKYLEQHNPEFRKPTRYSIAEKYHSIADLIAAEEDAEKSISRANGLDSTKTRHY